MNWLIYSITLVMRKHPFTRTFDVQFAGRINGWLSLSQNIYVYLSISIASPESENMKNIFLLHRI
ncbi:MAG TPA: hypothetical protein VGQ09_19565 [Chitinophagaceae bacterium]|nr:hypothetical protein [Chitinophagaceae bacterium]